MAVDPKALTDKAQVRNLLANAQRLGQEETAIACLERLAELGAQERSSNSPVEVDCWKAIIAAEEFASRKNGRTTRLSRTRQKVERVGVVQTISDLAGSPVIQQGFEILRDSNRLDLSFEAVALRYPDIFNKSVRDDARSKLRSAGFSPTGG